jgi:hypothetical protein
MTATVALSNTLLSDNVTKRTVTVVINGTALPPIDATNSAATFPVSPGDVGTVTDTDFNAAGPSVPSPLFPFAVPAAPTVPVQPTVLGVTFA